MAVAAPLFAQPAQTGTISGVIQDRTGGVMPGVTVSARSQDRGFARSTVTDANGRFLFPAVPIGPYTVVAVLQGFETAQSTDNLVETDKTTAVAVTMKVGALTDTVQVIGDTPIVDITNTTANTRIRREEFEKLPVGRSYQQLIATVPGVVGSGNVNAMGALISSNLFIIDSVDTTDPTTGTFGTNLNFEAIQEVSVYTSGVSAEYGRAQGRHRQRDHQVGHQQVRGLGQVHLPERQLGQAEHDQERDHRRVAGARQVRQGEPGLRVHRRRTCREEPGLVLRRV